MQNTYDKEGFVRYWWETDEIHEKSIERERKFKITGILYPNIFLSDEELDQRVLDAVGTMTPEEVVNLKNSL